MCPIMKTLSSPDREIYIYICILHNDKSNAIEKTSTKVRLSLLNLDILGNGGRSLYCSIGGGLVSTRNFPNVYLHMSISAGTSVDERLTHSAAARYRSVTSELARCDRVSQEYCFFPTDRSSSHVCVDRDRLESATAPEC